MNAASKKACGVVALACALVAEAAFGAEPSATPASAPGGALSQRRPFVARPLRADELALQRGGDGVSLGAQLQGSVSGNTASQVVTGSNTIAGGAFAGSNGVTTVIQNTGNNVLIQNAVVVNLQLK